MKDREFLIWLRDRIEQNYNVNRNCDWMRRLGVIIAAMSDEQNSVYEEPKKTLLLVKPQITGLIDGEYVDEHLG